MLGKNLEIRRLTASFKNADFLEIHQCGHMPQEEKPDEIVEQMTKFIISFQ
jgi:pimeloyl-ACP methyl ester carboxylesterase